MGEETQGGVTIGAEEKQAQVKAAAEAKAKAEADAAFVTKAKAKADEAAAALIVANQQELTNFRAEWLGVKAKLEGGVFADVKAFDDMRDDVDKLLATIGSDEHKSLTEALAAHKAKGEVKTPNVTITQFLNFYSADLASVWNSFWGK